MPIRSDETVRLLKANPPPSRMPYGRLKLVSDFYFYRIYQPKLCHRVSFGKPAIPGHHSVATRIKDGREICKMRLRKFRVGFCTDRG